MSYHTIRISVIDVIGYIWQPGVGVCAQQKELSDYDERNMTDESGQITRESVQAWLDCYMGDFSQILDFRADIGDTLIEWEDAESEWKYTDCMYPPED